MPSFWNYLCGTGFHTPKGFGMMKAPNHINLEVKQYLYFKVSFRVIGQTSKAVYMVEYPTGTQAHPNGSEFITI